VQPEAAYVLPALEEVPSVPKTAGEEPIPAFAPPEPPGMAPLILPGAEHVPGPELPERPSNLPDASPEHGADWTGERPHREEAPEFVEPALEAEEAFVVPEAPPAPLPLVRGALTRLHLFLQLVYRLVPHASLTVAIVVLQTRTVASFAA
jgi:hypothetical protein